MNKQLTTILGTAIISGGAVFGATTLTPTTAPNPIILQDNVESHSRLLEPAVWDTSVATGQEVTDAYIKVAEKYGVTTKDITASGGNIQTAIQTKLQTQGLLCAGGIIK